jgi:hypothetical protein
VFVRLTSFLTYGNVTSVPLLSFRRQGGELYSSYSLFTSVLDRVSGQRHAPAALYFRGKDTRYPLHGRLGGPQSWSGHRDVVINSNHKMSMQILWNPWTNSKFVTVSHTETHRDYIIWCPHYLKLSANHHLCLCTVEVEDRSQCNGSFVADICIRDILNLSPHYTVLPICR